MIFTKVSKQPPKQIGRRIEKIPLKIKSDDFYDFIDVENLAVNKSQIQLINNGKEMKNLSEVTIYNNSEIELELKNQIFWTVKHLSVINSNMSNVFEKFPNLETFHFKELDRG